MKKLDIRPCISLLNKLMTDEVNIIQLAEDSIDITFVYRCMPSYEARKLLTSHIYAIVNYLTTHVYSMCIDSYVEYIAACYRETNGKVDSIILAFQELTPDTFVEFQKKFREYSPAVVSIYDEES